MRILLLAALAAMSFASIAAERTYAVLSFVGDRLLITQAVAETGTRVDRNVRQYAATGSDALDKVALRAVKAGVVRVDAGAKVETLSVSNSRFYGAANAAMEQGGIGALVTMLRPDLRDIPATHWILVTKHRGDARVPLREGTIGSGQMEGLGFYIDRFRRVQLVDTGEGAEGVLAPFAYLHFTLVDAASGAVLRELNETMSTTVARQSATHPWDTLTADEKVAYLERLIRRAADDAVPKLLAP
jgi:hypothetical protein